jgi:hypothetical protein
MLFIMNRESESINLFIMNFYLYELGKFSENKKGESQGKKLSRCQARLEKKETQGATRGLSPSHFFRLTPHAKHGPISRSAYFLHVPARLKQHLPTVCLLLGPAHISCAGSDKRGITAHVCFLNVAPFGHN